MGRLPGPGCPFQKKSTVAVFLTRGHPHTARFLNRMSAVFTPLKRQNAPRGAGKGCWGGLGGSMACCILGPPTLSTFPASMCSLRATWADEAISQVQKAGRKGQVRGSKGPSFLLAGSARRGFLAPRANAHGAVFFNGFLMTHYSLGAALRNRTRTPSGSRKQTANKHKRQMFATPVHVLASSHKKTRSPPEVQRRH